MRLVNYYTLYAMWPICAKIGRGFSVVKCFIPAGERKLAVVHLTLPIFILLEQPLVKYKLVLNSNII